MLSNFQSVKLYTSDLVGTLRSIVLGNRPETTLYSLDLDWITVSSELQKLLTFRWIDFFKYTLVIIIVYSNHISSHAIVINIIAIIC